MLYRDYFEARESQVLVLRHSYIGSGGRHSSRQDAEGYASHVQSRVDDGILNSQNVNGVSWRRKRSACREKTNASIDSARFGDRRKGGEAV